MTIAFFGIGDTLLIEKKGNFFVCHFITKVEGAGSNFAKWCKHLVVHYGFSPAAFLICFFYYQCRDDGEY
jgi:hypothetical protein